MSTLSRFAPSRSTLHPIQKLEESVDLLLQQRLSPDDYLEVLGEVGDFVQRAQDQLIRVQFPSHYDAGPVLLEYAFQGLDSLADTLDQLQDLCQYPDPGRAQVCLQEAHEAFGSLQDLLHEVKVERGLA